MQFQICNSGEVWTSVSRGDAHRIAKKRTGALAAIIRQVRKAQRQEAREYRRTERELQAEMREADRSNRALWKRVRVKPEGRSAVAFERRPQAHRPTRTGWLADAAMLPSYSGQIIDRMGRAGIFFRVRYYSSSTKPGVGRRSTLYIWTGAHETDDGRIMFESNAGETIEEAVAALEAVELFNREAQDGAKVLFHAIANVPYQLLEMNGGVERMFEIGRRFAQEQFGSRDLPFALALHPPSEEGDQRNWHLHVIFSTRPLVRTGDHEWDIGRMMRREIDNPEAFEEMRHLYARIQSEVAQEAGLNMTYTALSNAERGLPNAPQKHLNSARTARVRRGERDEVNESNWKTMLAGEAALLDEQLRHAQELAVAEQALLDRVEDRTRPLTANLTAGPRLVAAAVDSHAEPIAAFTGTAIPLLADRPVTAHALPIANLQLHDRTIADLTGLEEILHSDTRGAPGVVPSFSAVRSMAQSIDVPHAASNVVADISHLSFAPSPTAVRTRHHHIARLPQLSAELPNPAVPPLSLGSPGTVTSERGVAKPPSWAATVSTTGDIGLSLAFTTRPAQRPLDPPKSALTDEDADFDVNAIFRLLDARRAELAMRERMRRERAAAERAEAERAQKAKDERHAREEAEQQRLDAEQSVARQADRDTADALEAMTNAIEAERIFVLFDNDRCVVDDAVIKRFGIASTVIANPEAQARLDAIADRQRVEIEPLTTYASANGGHIVQRDRRWTLSQDAPGNLRRIADAWVHEPLLQKALAEAAEIYRKAQSGAQRTPPITPAVASAQRPSRQELLIMAAQQREALTGRWQKNRRFDHVHAPHRTGNDVAAQQSSSSISPLGRPVRLDPGQDR